MAVTKKKKILISWLGHTDLKAMAQGQPKAIQKEVMSIARDITPPEGGWGPVRTLLEFSPYQEVYLLSDYSNKVNNAYLKWLGHKAKTINVKLENPTDYKEIFVKADTVVTQIIQSRKTSNCEVSFLLSPGTPTMAAIWVLLGKTKYHPAKFYQTYKGKAWETEIPFDVTVDYVPELLKGSDRIFQHLASRSPQEIEGFEDIVGESRAIRLAVGKAQKAAIRDVPMLLLGESGTGKEMFAHAIHKASHRRNSPFIAINCAAIPKELLESELFGHKKGAYTGALADRDGAFKRADSGILFLDEIGECNPDIQAKLLRVLQPLTSKGPCFREYYPVGANKPQYSDVRIIAATNRDLMTAVEENEFREDLYYRLSVISIKLPPLRERKADISLLVDVLLEQINNDFTSQDPIYKYKKISASAKKIVKNHLWPGNVRQLYNVLLQAAVMSNEEIIQKDEIVAAISDMPGSKDKVDLLEQPFEEGFELQKFLDEIQVHYLQRAMKDSDGVKTKAANLLGMKNYQTLDAQLKRLSVNWEKD